MRLNDLRKCGSAPHAWSPPNFPHNDKVAKAKYATEGYRCSILEDSWSPQPRKYRPPRANVSVCENMKSRLNWNTLLAEQRLRELLGGSKSTKVARESRTEYERDRDRTVYSSPVRRLIRKTQVFPLDPSDFIRTRLMHSMEVSTVAEGLASQSVRDVIRKKEKRSPSSWTRSRRSLRLAVSSTISAIRRLATPASLQLHRGLRFDGDLERRLSRTWAVQRNRRLRIF